MSPEKRDHDLAIQAVLRRHLLAEMMLDVKHRKRLPLQTQEHHILLDAHFDRRSTITLAFGCQELDRACVVTAGALSLPEHLDACTERQLHLPV